ncbi:MAG TPA: creatininase family protein [Rhizomicrobium sp.]|nr:creatininase family protein [Rhizomicrobium sp.]
MQSATPGLFIESLPWPAAEAAIKAFGTIVIPVGARCKEHGLHLPLNTDWVIAEYLAGRVAEQCQVVVLPTVQYGYYPAFLEYPGSVSIGEAIFRDCIADICRSFTPHGATRFYVLNTGLSTLKPLKAAQDLLGNEGVRMDYTDTQQIARTERRAVQQQSHGTHADELETSMMLYIAPGLVELSRACPELAPARPGPLTRNPQGDGVYSATGAWGDPTLATRDKGERIVEATVREIVQAIQEKFR